MAEAIISRRGGGMKIVSLQHGYKEGGYGTQLIAPVNMDKAILICNQSNGYRNSYGNHNRGGYAVLDISGEFITFYGSADYALNFYWQVLEVEGVKSIQRGFVTSTGNITVSPVNIGRAILVVNKSSGSRGTMYSDYNYGVCVSLEDAETIKITGTADVAFGMYWQLIEF